MAAEINRIFNNSVEIILKFLSSIAKRVFPVSMTVASTHLTLLQFVLDFLTL